MTSHRTPTDTAVQLQWLVDRAEISDLLIKFARSLDEKDCDAHTALYVPDGVFTATPCGSKGTRSFAISGRRRVWVHEVWHAGAPLQGVFNVGAD